MDQQFEYDVFISHAFEDKEAIARPLAIALRRKGLSVWYDEFSLKVGDSLSTCIDQGLSRSKFGIVIISPNFIRKKWTQVELSALKTRNVNEEHNLIIPIWHEISWSEIRSYSAILVDLVSIPTENETPESIVEKILDNVNFYTVNPNEDIFSTGLIKLDRALKGGFPRPSSIALVGPKGIGKTLLATQIQINSLQRGEPCVYVTYREPPLDIFKNFERLGGDLEKYIQLGKFRLMDNFTAIAGLLPEDTDDALPKFFVEAIDRVSDPTNAELYYREHVKQMKQLGTGGINVIDSVNERIELYESQDVEAKKHFNRMRAKLARHSRQSAIHILGKNDKKRDYSKIVDDFQDGIITMNFEQHGGDRRRMLQIQSLRGSWFNEKPLEFIITNKGIQLLD